MNFKNKFYYKKKLNKTFDIKNKKINKKLNEIQKKIKLNININKI